MKKINFFLITFILFSLSRESFCKEDEILKLIQSKYKSISSFTGNFVQISFKKNVENSPKKALGSVSYKRPGKMRWLYSHPEEHLLVTNGNTLWLFDPLLENVTVQRLKNIAESTALSFLLGIGDLNKDFQIREISQPLLDDSDGLIVELVPKKSNLNLLFIQLQVNPKTYHLRKILLMDQEGNYRTIELDLISYNLELNDKLFEFKISEDMEVIDTGY